MLDFNEKIIKEARKTRSVEELLELAKANDLEIPEDQVKNLFELVNTKSGELSDEELDNVAGGICYTPKGYPIRMCYDTCRIYENDGKYGAIGFCETCIYGKRIERSFYHCLYEPYRRKKK